MKLQGAQEKIREIKRNWRIWRLPLILLAVLFALTGAAIYALVSYSANSVKEELRKAMLESVEQRKNHLDFRLQSVGQTTENLMGIVYPYMNSTGDRESQYKEYEELSYMIVACTDSELVSRVRLYVPGDKIYSNQGDMFCSLDSLAEDEALSKYLDQIGLAWQETKFVGSFERDKWIYSPIISCVYSARSTKDYTKVACVLFVEMDVSRMHDIFVGDEEAQEQLYLINRDGKCLAATDTSMIDRTVLEDKLLSDVTARESGSLAHGGLVYAFEQLDNADWDLVMTKPETELHGSWPLSGIFGIVLGGILLVFGIFCVFLAYDMMSKITLHRINRTLAELLGGTETAAEDIHNLSQTTLIGHLERNVEQMVFMVRDLMEKQYQGKLEVAEYQMRALQNQIKPHFLYNTLDVIKWMIMENKEEDSVWMVNALSKYLRQSINKGPAVIPLSEELELSRYYLMIMQRRFENRFAFSFEVEDEAGRCYLPRFSLQPLLENALLHGILYDEKPEKYVRIRAWREEQMLYIEIEDNGKGMQKDALKKAAQGGYGLENVKKRLMIFGDGKTEFNISSRVGVGTCITILLPIKEEGT